MHSDPILREVHRMKDQFARKYDYDLDKIFDHLREEAKKHPERMVRSISETATPPNRRTAAGGKSAK